MLCPLELRGQEVKLVTYIYLARSLEKRGATIPPSVQTIARKRNI